MCGVIYLQFSDSCREVGGGDTWKFKVQLVWSVLHSGRNKQKCSCFIKMEENCESSLDLCVLTSYYNSNHNNININSEPFTEVFSNLNI